MSPWHSMALFKNQSTKHIDGVRSQYRCLMRSAISELGSWMDGFWLIYELHAVCVWLKDQCSSLGVVLPYIISVIRANGIQQIWMKLTWWTLMTGNNRWSVWSKTCNSAKIKATYNCKKYIGIGGEIMKILCSQTHACMACFFKQNIYNISKTEYIRLLIHSLCMHIPLHNHANICILYYVHIWS